MKKRALSILATAALGLAVGCSNPKRPPPSPETTQQAFSTPKEAADALIRAASSYDVSAMLAILGPDAKDLIASQDPVQDKNRALKFAEKAKEKNAVEVDGNDPARATLIVGKDDWPLPIPLVMRNGKWVFDSAAGHDEVLKRRVGVNELDVINVLRGYVEAQQQYASEVHDRSGVNQYAKRIISTPGKHDGLAWQNPDGTWAGPVGNRVARALDQGYAAHEPFHGYYFKTLEGQGPSARLGQMDYVVGDAMIGGFALVAWPAEYDVTGVQTFIVSYDGTVHQKDLGPKSADIAAAMVRYDPDKSWQRTDDAR